MNTMLLFETLLLCIIGVISPGPNFLMVVANTIESGKKAGIITAIGVGLGVSVWLLICGLGLGFLLSSYKWVEVLLNILACIFIFYIGIKIIKNKNKINEINKKDDGIIRYETSISFMKYGFIGTILNFGVGIFYSIIFAKLILEYSNNIKYIILHGFIFNIIEFSWFLFVAHFVAFSSKFINKYSSKINVLLGLLMIYFGIKIALNLIL